MQWGDGAAFRVERPEWLIVRIVKNICRGIVGGIVVVGLAGCSTTLGIRGQTQSVAGVGASYDYRAPPQREQTDQYTYNQSRRGYEPERGIVYQPPSSVRSSLPYERPSEAPAYRSAPQVNYDGGGRVTRSPARPSTPTYRSRTEAAARGATGAVRAPVQQRQRKLAPSQPTDTHGAQSTVSRRSNQRQAAAGPSKTEAPAYQQTGWARWMGASWAGHTTTTGEAFDANRLTAAHASLPLPSYLYVTNRANGRIVLLRINDRVPANKERIVVVSQRAANLLGFLDKGRAEVDIQYAGPAGRRSSGKYEEKFLQQQSWFAGLKPDERGPLLNSQRAAANSTAARSYPRWDGTRRTQ